MHDKQQAFTLIEVMIVVAIIGILAAIAYPSYQRYVIQTNRTDAQSVLTEIARAEEAFFNRHDEYTATIKAPGGCSDASCGLGFADTLSEQGHYQLAITVPNDGLSFTATATPVAGKIQDQDDECATFSINNLGQRLAKDSSGNSNSDECW